ncbi:MAG: hypothetical protein D3923_17395 [Candidatus Electrothrix sp. AR3]|nr:hypothetical protein [Candidatus Electrothrix sp. AR3]
MKDEDENIRVAAANALSNLGELPIADTLQDNSPSVRLCAIEASRDIKDSSVNRMLINTFIKDDRYEVRLLAIDVLAHRKSQESVPYLEEALTDDNKEIRIAAEYALKKIINEK